MSSPAAGNRTLSDAKRAKQDEFYTQLSDINNELRHYKKQFENKVVLCNCDDPYESNFFQYFALNFNALKLKKLICTSYDGSPIAGQGLLFEEYDEGNGKRQKPKAVAITLTEVKDETGDGATGIDDVELFLKKNKAARTPLEKRIKELIEDDEVDSKKGIYEYLLTGNEKTLSLRTFSDKIKSTTFHKQKGKCPTCKKTFEIGQMEADHIVPWSKGGKTVAENCQMLCMPCNRSKGGK